MAIEQGIIERIGSVSEKNICVIGNMSEEFYALLSENLTGGDSVYIFDTSANIKKAESALNGARYNKIKLMPFPVTNKKFDWYGWHLLRYYHQLQKLGVSSQIFNAVFYRGKHLFQYDMGSLPLVMNMLSDGGFLAVYDCAWSLAKSPTMKPEVNAETAAHYTKEQISLHHMQYLLDVYIDKNFLEQEGLSSAKTRVYRKGQAAASSSVRDLYY